MPAHIHSIIHSACTAHSTHNAVRISKKHFSDFSKIVLMKSYQFSNTKEAKVDLEVSDTQILLSV